MKAPRNRKMNRKPYDRRADTPEARKIRAERRMRRFYCSCGTTPRHHYAHWLNQLMEDRQPAQPSKGSPAAKPTTAYPLGNDFGRRLLSNAQSSHSRRQPFFF